MKNLKCTVLALTMGASIFIGGKALAQVPNYVPTNGLVGWWPFNGNANDESGNGNNGTVNGATLTTDQFGNINKAYSFDGNQYIDITTTNGLTSINSISMSIWFNWSGPNSWSHQYFYQISPNPNGAITINNDGTLSVNVLNCNCQSDLGISTVVNQNTWYHVVLTYELNLGLMKMYLNGLLIGTTQENIFSYYTTNNPGDRFGCYHFNEYFFNGKLDDAGLWNRALTDQEIIDLYNSNSCSNDLTINPLTNFQSIGGNAIFNASTSDSNPSYVWQSDFGQGFQTLNNFGNYSGVNTNALTISNVQLVNHNQPIRAISTSGNCIDTSNTATIQIADTCITNVTVYDTLLTTVTDTLIINTTLSLPAPNNENTILIYPNPASDHITIDNGNYTAMAGYTIKIENNAGQQVFQSVINQQQFYVDLSTWIGNGLYFVHLIDAQNNTVTVRKIVLQ
jgi:hypothetical protein